MKIFFILILSIACYEGHAQKSSAAADSFYFKQNWPLAISLYKTFLGDTSHSPLLWQRLAYAQFQAGEYNDAIASYNKSLSNKPNPILKNIIFTNMLNIFAAQNKPSEVNSPHPIPFLFMRHLCQSQSSRKMINALVEVLRY